MSKSLAQDLAEHLFPGQIVRRFSLHVHPDEVISVEVEVYLIGQQLDDLREMLTKTYSFELVPTKASNDCSETGSN